MMFNVLSIEKTKYVDGVRLESKLIDMSSFPLDYF